MNRALKFCYSNYEKTIPKISPDQYIAEDIEFFKLAKEKYEKYVKELNKVEIKEGLKIAMDISSLGNKYLQDSKFWEAENKKSGRSQIVSGIVCNFIRLVSLVIEPYMPSTSAKINFLLGLERTERDDKLGFFINSEGFDNIFHRLTENSKGLKEPVTLFK